MERPPVKPLETPMVPFAAAGIAIWAVLGSVLLAAPGWAREHGHTRWLWTCVAGVALGLPGLFLMIRHDRNRRLREPGDPAQNNSPSDSAA
jgi:Protein of unknown function (DUF2530)